MNKILIYLSAILILATAKIQAQDRKDEGVISRTDTTIISWRKKEFVIVKDNDGTHMSIQNRYEDDWDRDRWRDDDWDDDDRYYDKRDDDGDDDRRRRRAKVSEVDVFAFDFGLTNYYVDNEIGKDAAIPDLELKAFRPGSHLGLHFLPTRVSLDRRGVMSMRTAITLDISSHNFLNPISPVADQEIFTYTMDSTISYEKNKLVARYVQVPLMLSLNTAPDSDKGLKISVGGYAGVLWNGILKQEAAGIDKIKIKDDFNLSKFRYGLMARFDFRWLDLYVNYNLSSLFEDNQGPATQTFTAGINIIDF